VSWRAVDFALIWLGGLVGTFAFFGAAEALSVGDSGLIVAGLAGQYVGNLGVLGFMARRRESLGLTIEPGDLRTSAWGSSPRSGWRSSSNHWQGCCSRTEGRHSR
jgi:hypothetical protein